MKKVLAVSLAVISVTFALAIGCGTEGSKATARQPIAEVKVEPARPDEKTEQTKAPDEGKKAEPAKDIPKAEPTKDEPESEKYPKAATAGLNTRMHRVSYCIGHQIGSGFRTQGIGEEIDMGAFDRGIKDGMTEAEGLLTLQEKREILRVFSVELRQRLMERRRLLAEKNKKVGEAFLAENAKKEGVIVRESGVQYNPFHNQLAERQFPTFVRLLLSRLLNELACEVLRFAPQSPFARFDHIRIQDGTSFAVKRTLA